MAHTFPPGVRNGNAAVSRREIAVFDPQAWLVNHALGVTLGRYKIFILRDEISPTVFYITAVRVRTQFGAVLPKKWTKNLSEMTSQTCIL